MKTLSQSHPIRRRLSDYYSNPDGYTWTMFANCCISYGADPEVIACRYRIA